MTFYGLFLGVDRYSSPAVSWLSCASRDAQALYSLFADTFGSSSAVLLCDEQATRAAIVEDFDKRLSNSAEDDLVVITFSGHGSDDHYLVTHDADPDDLRSTSIHLDELVDLFSRVPARRIILILDCCFSGGAGARVFKHGPTTRSVKSVDDALRAIAHEGRVVITACDPNQEAIEDPFFGHGLLTWFLIDGLRGSPEVMRDGKVPILVLADYVTRRVHDEATSVGHDQRPTLRGTVDGSFSLPPLVPGAEYARRFPERSAPPVTDEVAGLEAHGVPPFVIDVWRKGIPGLNDLQQRAVNEFGVLAARNLVVSAPTSSGKTMIGELAALAGFAQRKRALFLLPLKALVSDKFVEFGAKYGALGVKIIRATGDMHDDIPDLLAGRFDIALMTYEKASGVVLASPHVLRGIGTIVVDEVQMLADPSRGANLEFLLTLLKYRRRDGVRPQIILLSAVIGDTNGLERWMNAGLLRTHKRPVPLSEGVLRWDGSFRHITDDGTESVTPLVNLRWPATKAQDLLIPLSQELAASDERLIIFRETKSETRSVATYLATASKMPPARSAMDALPTNDLSAGSLALRACLDHGIAFHNADLGREERRIVEDAFRSRDGVQVVVATTTIAMGVNTPASTVAIRGLQHPGGEPYTVAEYKNMVGRAGRLGFAEVGKAMIVCLNQAEEYQAWTRYVKAQPEALVSRFLSGDPMLLIARVIATAEKARLPGMTAEEVVGFVQSSFGAYQQAQRQRHPINVEALRKDLNQLVSNDLVRLEGDGYRLTDLGRLAGEGGVAIRSVVGLVRALRGIPLESLTDVALIAATQATSELDDVFVPIHRKSHKERARWLGAIQNRGIPLSLLSAILVGDEATARAKRAEAAFMWTQGMDIRDIEASLLTHMPGQDAAGAIRAIADRTRDLMPTALRVAEILNSTTNTALAESIERLLVRLELGIPETLVDLASHVGSRITRGDYLALNRIGLITPDAVIQASDDALRATPLSTRAIEVLRRDVTSL